MKNHKGYYIGLDIGGTKCAVVHAEVKADERIQILERCEIPTEPELGLNHTLEGIKDTVTGILKTAKEKSPKAIGISCGGPLDSHRGIVLSPPNLPGWDNVPLTAIMKECYNIPAYLQNDANACALVEWKLGAGRGCKNMVFLTMGTGMGAGIIAGGRLINGACDMAGEVGHIRLDNDGPVGYGKVGSFEGFASGGGITRYAHMTMPDEWLQLYSEEEITAKFIAEAAKRGETAAKNHFERVGEKLGMGISIILDMLNPERIVIGSIFKRCEGLLRPAMERAISREALPQTAKVCRIVAAETGEQIGDYASVMTAIYADSDKN